MSEQKAPKKGHGIPWREKIPKTQAERVLAKFGGARRLFRLMKAIEPSLALNPSSIYRWTYPREKGGTGGLIPSHILPFVQRLALMDGILLDEQDLFPGIVSKRDWEKSDPHNDNPKEDDGISRPIRLPKDWRGE